MFKVEENRTIYLDDKGNILGEVDYPYISSNVVDVNHTYVDISLRGKGIENVNSKRKGDMYIITKIIIKNFRIFSPLYF